MESVAGLQMQEGYQIAPLLCLLFYESFQLGILPDKWKLVCVVMFKTEETKGRPIDVSRMISKLMRREHMGQIINGYQHGLLPGKSGTSLLVQIPDVTRTLDD